MSKGSDYDIDKFDLELRKQELIKQGQQAARGFGAYNHPIIPTLYSTTTTYDHRRVEREIEDIPYEEVKPLQIDESTNTHR